MLLRVRMPGQRPHLSDAAGSSASHDRIRAEHPKFGYRSKERYRDENSDSVVSLPTSSGLMGTLYRSNDGGRAGFTTDHLREGKSVADTSESVGYRSVSAFINAFGAHHRSTPLNWTALWREEQGRSRAAAAALKRSALGGRFRRPVFNLQPRHPREFPGVVGD